MGTRSRDGSSVAKLSASDALLWRIDRDPLLRTTIVAVLLLDRPPEWETLAQRLTSISRLVQKMRATVREPLGWGESRWVEDLHFDLRFHLRRMRASAPGSLRTLLEMVDPIAMSDVDRMRPPWEITVVEGLENGRAAVVLKTHHVLTDGVGGIQVALRLLDRSRRPRKGPLTSETASATPGVKPASAPRGVGERLVSAVQRLGAGLGSDPLAELRRLATSASAVGRLVAPSGRPLSLLMTDRSLSRRVEMLDLPVARLAAASTRLGVSMNDVFISSLLGGFRLYHERHGVTQDRLRVNMPVSLRRQNDPLGGNRFSPVRFVVPVSMSDPVERTRRVSELTSGWKSERALSLTDALAVVLSRLPAEMATPIFGAMLKGVDFVATNIPGPTFRTYLAGGRVLGLYAFAPPSGAAASISLCTEADRACVGMNLDTAAIPDSEFFARCVAEGFDEVAAEGSVLPVADVGALRVGGR